MKRIKINLSELEEKQLGELLLKNRDSKVYKRLLCIRLLNEGKKNKEVAEILDVTLETIKNWLVIYKRGGFVELTSMYEEMRESSLNAYKDEILEFLTKNTVCTIWQVVDYVNNELGLMLKYHAVRNFLKKNSILFVRNQNRYRLRKPTEKCSSVL